MISTSIFNLFSAFVSFSTLFGVVFHDTHIDKYSPAMLGVPSIMIAHSDADAALKLSSEAHTHTERVSLNAAVRNFTNENPRIQPRLSNEKKYVLQKNVMKGHHAFDNYYLPVLA